MHDPMTPADCDLRDFPRMMIDIPRLRASAFDATPDDSAWRAALNLWMSSWHGDPAASLENDDGALCKAAGLGRDLKTWRKVESVALRGWELCSDGKLYHPTVAEFALEAWLEKLGQRLSSGAGNAKRWGATFDPEPVKQAIEASARMLAALNPQSRALPKAFGRASRQRPEGRPDVIPSGSQEKGEGTGTGNLEEREIVVSGETTPADPQEVMKAVHAVGEFARGLDLFPAKSKRRAYPDEFEAAWKAYPHHEGRSSKPNSLTEWKKLPAEERAGLVAAITRFRPKVAEVCGGKGAPCMSRWLKDGKHLNWAQPAGASQPVDLSTWPVERWAAVVDRWRLTGLWNDRLGPPPDRPDTLVPATLRPAPAAA